MIAITSFDKENHFLSNFYSSVIEITMYQEKFSMPTGEHAFHAGKIATSQLPTPERIAWLRLLEKDPHPAYAKRMGRSLIINVDHWNSISTMTMERTVALKFQQNYSLKDKLLATGNVELIEGNTWGDKIWGQVNGVGENRLGKILMEVRDALRFQHLIDKTWDLVISHQPCDDKTSQVEKELSQEAEESFELFKTVHKDYFDIDKIAQAATLYNKYYQTNH